MNNKTVNMINDYSDKWLLRKVTIKFLRLIKACLVSRLFGFRRACQARLYKLTLAISIQLLAKMALELIVL